MNLLQTKIYAGLATGVVLLCAASASAQTYYSTTSQGQTNGYYTNAQPLALQQMVAGQNAPSYNYDQTSQTSSGYGYYGASPYTGSYAATTSGYGAQGYTASGLMSPDEEAQYYASANGAQGQGMIYNPTISVQQRLNNLANMGPFTTKEQEEPKTRVVRRLSRNALNDPLAPPPRLFNPDQ